MGANRSFIESMGAWFNLKREAAIGAAEYAPLQSFIQ
jgi:hypothetical protein